MHYDHINVPADGAPITANPDHSLNVPDCPVIPYIEGDGIGIDVTPVMLDVVNAAVRIAYGEKREIKWMQVYAGAKATEVYGENEYLPEETLDAFRRYLVSIKGPLATPTGGGIRSLNVAIRQTLDLYACVRPIRYFPGVQTPMLQSELVSMTVSRKHGRHLRRYRIPDRVGGSAKTDSFSANGTRRYRNSLPAQFGNWHQAGVARGFRAINTQSDTALYRSRYEIRNARTQGQHHEIHRGRFLPLGI